MPPRSQQRPPQSLTPQPGAQASPIAQLNSQQLAALQEHIRQTRAQTGQEITPAMITEWMVRNGIQPGGGGGGGGGAPQQQQQQQQPVQQVQQQQQQQGLPPQLANNVEAVLNHLYPPQLAADPRAALQHLTNVLFPPHQGHKQSPFLQQVMLLAQNGRLSQEQMGQLKQAVAMKNGAQAQAQQQQQQQQQQQYQQQQQHPQAQQLQQVAMGQPTPQIPPQGLPQATPAGAAATNEQSATQAVQQLRNRVQHIETLLARPDVNDEQRAKMQVELETARQHLARVFKMLVAAQQQQQAQQASARIAGVAGAQPGVQVSDAVMHDAQRQALERKAREIQAQQVAAAQAKAAQAVAAQQQQQQQQQAANGQFRTASPATGFVGGSPALVGGALPQLGGVGGDPATNPQAAAAQAAAAAAAAQAAAQGKKLTKKQQAEVHALSQQQAAQQAQAQAQALAQAQQLAQTQAAANQKAVGAGTPQPGVGGGAGGGAGGAYGAAGLQANAAIPGTLSVQPPVAEAFPPARPTISGGLAANPSISTPAITKPGMLSSSFSLAGMEGGEGGVVKEALPNKDQRADDSKGRTVSKRKIRELVEAVDPEERLSDEVEDLLLEICDEFIDSVTRFGCQLAKHRKSDRLEVKDLALHLDRSYNIRIPGFAPDETRASGSGVTTRRVNLPPGHAARLAAIREGEKRRR
ncbi:hypothetical protein JCM8097_000421 [Rhodosporidiobolus ruineniae]